MRSLIRLAVRKFSAPYAVRRAAAGSSPPQAPTPAAGPAAGARVGGRRAAGRRAALPVRLPHHGAGRARRRGAPEPGPLRHPRPRALPARPALPHRLGPRRPHRPRQDDGRTRTPRWSSRYAAIAARPEGQVDKVRSALVGLGVDSRGGRRPGRPGRSPPGRCWSDGRGGASCGGRLTSRRTAGGGGGRPRRAGAGLLAVGPRRPAGRGRHLDEPAGRAAGGAGARRGARRCRSSPGSSPPGPGGWSASAVDTYRRSVSFYSALVEAAPALRAQLHQPADGEVVGLLVSDRHDNIGMDPVARADRGPGPARPSCSTPATTPRRAGRGRRSAWSRWTRRSTTSTRASPSPATTTTATSSPARPDGWASRRSTARWSTARRGMRLLGVSDPRSSGLGTWRDERGISFSEQERPAGRLGLRARRATATGSAC